MYLWLWIAGSIVMVGVSFVIGFKVGQDNQDEDNACQLTNALKANYDLDEKLQEANIQLSKTRRERDEALRQILTIKEFLIGQTRNLRA